MRILLRIREKEVTYFLSRFNVDSSRWIKVIGEMHKISCAKCDGWDIVVLHLAGLPFPDFSSRIYISKRGIYFGRQARATTLAKY